MAEPSPEALERVALTRMLHLWQRRRGHRVGTDDVVLAGLAAEAAPAARRVLDLGAGHGAVTLMVAAALPEASFVAVEAQEVSAALLRRNVEENGLGGRIEVRQGDLREADSGGSFDLVTGTPPFLPPGTGVMPEDAQRAAARFELRGGIEDYARAAAAGLGEGGIVVLLMDAARPERYERAIGDAGLALRKVVRVQAFEGGPVRYLAYVAARDGAGGEAAREAFAVRDAARAWTPEFAALRRRLDLP